MSLHAFCAVVLYVGDDVRVHGLPVMKVTEREMAVVTPLFAKGDEVRLHKLKFRVQVKRANVMYLQVVRRATRLTRGLQFQVLSTCRRPMTTALLGAPQVGRSPTLLRKNGAGDRRGSHVRDRNDQAANTPLRGSYGIE